MANYIEVVQTHYPGRKIHADGDGTDYSLLIADDGLPLPPKSEMDTFMLALTKLQKWEEIKAERDRRKFNGVKVGTSWFHSDDSSRIQQIGLMLMGASMPAGIMWKTMTDTFIQMTPALAVGIFQATGAQDMAIFARAEYHRAMMNASPNPSTYDYSTGWPLTFGE
jgi:hypothetical protein